MEGVMYLTDEKNKRRFVQIDMDVFGGEYLEDLIEGLVANSRKEEESYSLESVLEELKQEGKLDEI